MILLDNEYSNNLLCRQERVRQLQILHFRVVVFLVVFCTSFQSKNTTSVTPNDAIHRFIHIVLCIPIDGCETLLLVLGEELAQFLNVRTTLKHTTYLYVS